MSYTIDSLKDKIREFHPEMAQKGVNLTVVLEAGGDKYLVKLGKAGEEFGFLLEKKDADDCMSGKSCVNLALQVAQGLAELEELIAPAKLG